MNIIEEYLENNLLRVLKPGRYIGSEINAVIKEHTPDKLKMVLAFPDVYEIGMSYFGFQILYHIINQKKEFICERTYHPWPDFEKLLREDNIPLFSLETKTPVNKFDVIGFTFQYELNYTGMLNMLDLSGIPVRSAKRGEDDPIILGGGPSAFNPEPMADFFDAFFIGDAETVINILLEKIFDLKQKNKSKETILAEISGFDFIYVPSFYEPVYDNGRLIKYKKIKKNAKIPVSANITSDLKPEFYSEKPLVPVIDTEHNRQQVEIFRGCTQGCRFCGAGIIYRPVRERNIDEIISESYKKIENTGYDELSLVSLSTSDYSGLNELLSAIKYYMDVYNFSISFPSLRPDTFTEEMAEFAKKVRKSGLTFAPEAGTERLRNVINKNISETGLFKSVETAFKSGWHLIKLYFMIGLPTETHQDINGIVDTVNAILNIGRKYRKVNINISISPFTPKPFTPFQWEKQDDLNNLKKKSDYLKRNLKSRFIKLKYRNPEISLLEAILSRGDRKLSGVIENSWKNGAGLDGWDEFFDWNLWKKSFMDLKIEYEKYISERDITDFLPWDIINKGITKKFLLQEREKAFRAEPTADCRCGKCHACGLIREIQCNKTTDKKSIPEPYKIKKESTENIKYRLKFEKTGLLRFISHRDFIKLFNRSIKMSGLSVRYTEGFNPHPRVSFGPPLPLGISSVCEYMDISFTKRYLPEEIIENLNNSLPSGLKIITAAETDIKPVSILDSAEQVTYKIDFSKIENKTALIHTNQNLNPEINEYVDDISINGELRILILKLKIKNGRCINPRNVLRAIFNLSDDKLNRLNIEKIDFLF